MAREKAKELASHQVMEYDFEFRRGLGRIYREWQRGDVTEVQFKNNLCAPVPCGPRLVVFNLRARAPKQ